MRLRPSAHPSANTAPAFEEAKPELPQLPLGDLLLAYQGRSIKWLETTGLLVIEKSRRIGLTWGMAAHAALTAGSNKSAGGMHVWYMGTEMEMAREFIDAVAMWAVAFGQAAENEGEVVLEDPDGDIQAFRVRFSSGFRVTAIPSLPRALRGRQGLVIIDEAAFHKSIGEVLKAALALLIWGGKVVVISTHDGVDNPFNALIEDIKVGKRKGVVGKITFADALADGLYERIMLVRGLPANDNNKADWEADIRAFYGDGAEEELDCIPASGGGAWIDPADMTACEHPDAGKPALYQGGLVYIGRDVARRKDFAVIWAFEEINGILWLRERYEVTNTKFSIQAAAFDDMFKRYRVASAWVDQTGMGEAVVEAAQDQHGETRVQGVLFTPPNKLDLATALRDRFEAGTIRIPKEDAEIRADLRGIKRAGVGRGALAEAGDVHPDRFWAAALACRAADTPYQALTYRPVKPSNQNDADDIRFARPDAARFRSQRGAY
jgi:phage FluMu gp28-like protein